MDFSTYDVWYDPNEIGADNRLRVLSTWARPGLEIAVGKVVLIGDDELPPLFARILGFDDQSSLVTLEVLFDALETAAVA
jgi:hypothetical protein